MPLELACMYFTRKTTYSNRKFDIIDLNKWPIFYMPFYILNIRSYIINKWICHVKGGEKVRILPDKLAPIPESGQKFSRLRYDTS